MGTIYIHILYSPSGKHVLPVRRTNIPFGRWHQMDVYVFRTFIWNGRRLTHIPLHSVPFRMTTINTHHTIRTFQPFCCRRRYKQYFPIKAPPSPPPLNMATHSHTHTCTCSIALCAQGKQKRSNERGAPLYIHIYTIL